MTRRWLREPLVHFLALGALLFAVWQWRGGGASADRIVITSGQLDSLAATFARTWQRPPTEEELKGLIDDHVRDELATREAVAMGLDQDDIVIRRRLRQKLEFLVEDSLEGVEVTDAERQAWLEAHPEEYRLDPEVAFRQVYLSPERHERFLERDAEALLARLSAAGGDVDLAGVGDSLMLPSEVERSTRSSVARDFGEELADAVLKLEPGRWSGPVRSSYGLHLVWVHAREDGRMPALDDVRAVVDRDLLSARRRQRLDSMYTELLLRSKVVVERRPATTPDSGVTQPGSR